MYVYVSEVGGPEHLAMPGFGLFLFQFLAVLLLPVPGEGCGRPCCQSPEEGRKKTGAALCNFVFAGAWTIASANRWGYEGKLLRKVLFVSLLDDSLAVMLEGLLGVNMLENHWKTSH